MPRIRRDLECIKREFSGHEEKRAGIVYLEERKKRRKSNIKTTGSSDCAIKCEQVFAECRQRERSQRSKITTMTPIFVACVLLFALTCPCRAQVDYTLCRSNSECASGYCCSIGPMRYSMAQCRPFQGKGDTCRPGSASTINMTLGYPDGSEITLKDVHYILCPCAMGLTCDPKEGVCKSAEGKRGKNWFASCC